MGRTRLVLAGVTAVAVGVPAVLAVLPADQGLVSASASAAGIASPVAPAPDLPAAATEQRPAATKAAAAAKPKAQHPAQTKNRPAKTPPLVIADQPSLNRAPAAVVAAVPMPAGDTRRVVALRNTPQGPRATVELAPGRSAAVRTVERLQRQSDVVGVSIDTRVHAATDYTSSQWALPRLNATSVWANNTGTGVTVAVVDTGVQGDHPDLAGAVLSGAEFLDLSETSTGNGQTDGNGHGTHVAGIIAADRDDELVTGIAPGAKILPVRVLDGAGSGWNSDVINGIAWAQSNGADIINMSLGGEEDDPNMAAIIEAVTQAHIAVFAAAGNERTHGSPVSYPAVLPGVVAVSSVDSSNVVSSFSNHNDYVDIAAPGQSILSDYPTAKPGSPVTGLQTMSGTSMATPYAAGSAAALLGYLRETNPAAEGAAAVQPLLFSTTDLGPTGKDADYGFGLVNPYAAMAIADPFADPGDLPDTGAGPDAPTATGVQAVGLGGATVTFAAPGNPGSYPITGYQLACGASGRSTATAVGPAGANSLTVTGLVGGVAYGCNVRASNGAWGAWSNPVTVVARNVPAAPRITSITKLKVLKRKGRSYQKTATIRFSADPASPGITSFVARCTRPGGAAIQRTGTRSPLVVTGMAVAKKYTCRVRAANALGSSGWSAAKIVAARKVPR